MPTEVERFNYGNNDYVVASGCNFTLGGNSGIKVSAMSFNQLIIGDIFFEAHSSNRVLLIKKTDKTYIFAGQPLATFTYPKERIDQPVVRAITFFHLYPEFLFNDVIHINEAE